MKTMKKCKKCGFELKETNVVKSVKVGTNAEKDIAKGDSIISVDDRVVKNRSEIENALVGKENCKITVLHNAQRKSIDIESPETYINDIEFKTENVCLKCGKKQSSNKIPIIAAIFMLAAGAGAYFIFSNKQNKSSSEISDVASVLSEEDLSANVAEAETETLEQESEGVFTSYLPDPTVAKLKEILESNELDEESEQKPENIVYDLQALQSTRTRKKSSRGSSSTNNSIEDMIQNYEELKDTFIGIDNISEYKSNLGAKIYFKYGSYLDIGNSAVEAEKYLLVAKVESDKKEYASILLTLNDLLSEIPEEKRSSANFNIMGYADATLFNGKVEISERSERFNTELSLKRAESIKNILIGKDFNISPDRIITEGLGYSKNPDETENLEQYRRVDIVVSY